MRGRVDVGAAAAGAADAGTDEDSRAGAASLDEQAVAATAAQRTKTLKGYNMLPVL